jgi:hypothetical protein
MQYGEGIQFGFKKGFFAFELNFASENYDLLTGVYSQHQKFALGLMSGKEVIMGASLEREALGKTEMPKEDIFKRWTPGRSTLDILGNSEWKFKGYVGDQLINWGRGDMKLCYGVACGVSFELCINLSEIASRGSQFFFNHLGAKQDK